MQSYIDSVIQLYSPNDGFRNAMHNAGLISETDILADGEIHRFKPEGEKRNNGWYVFFGDGGSFGNWRTGLKQNWYRRDVDCKRKIEIRRNIRVVQKTHRDERERIHLEVAHTATQRWANAAPVKQHPYLESKGVLSHGLRLEGNNLLVPLASDQKIWSLQTISPDNKKFFLKGGRTGGCYFVIGKPHNNRIWITEGYATGASVHESTGDCVVVAFNASNLLPVSKTIRKLFRSHHIYIAADNDDVGRKKADEALNKTQIHGFNHPPVERGLTDWNDYFQKYGKQQTCTQLMRVLNSWA